MGKKEKKKNFFYISPQVGLEREQSLTIKKYIDHMYVIMPFEKKFYKI